MQRYPPQDTMRFEDKIRCLALCFNLSVTSWIRSRKRNADVGGVADSRHLLGLAVDVVLDDPGTREHFTKMATQLKLEVIDEGNHLHVQEPRF